VDPAVKINGDAEIFAAVFPDGDDPVHDFLNLKVIVDVV
jgi:hypothetical protein